MVSCCDTPSPRGALSALVALAARASQHPACPGKLAPPPAGKTADQAYGWVGLQEVRLKEGLFPEDQSEWGF